MCTPYQKALNMAKQQFVSVKNESPRMFENDILDYFSRVHPMVIPVIYIPLTSYFIYSALWVYGMNFLPFLGLFGAGIFFWTFFEYTLHRYFFHLEFKGKLGKRVHFIAHGVHHDFPNDHMRLVMPPGASLALAVILYWCFYALFGEKGTTASFFSGFMLGYFIYDMMHYATHHSNFKAKWFRAIKKNHMDHHYKSHDSGYGLSSPFWDIVFKTRHEDVKSKNSET